MSTTAQIGDILEHFDVELSNYEIVDLEEKKGWSAKFLYLIIEKNNQYVLKGKSKDQLTGYLSDIEISNYLLSHRFGVRKPIKTKDNKYHLINQNIYWDLKTYIPGSVEEFVNYTDDTVISLAKVNTTYINASRNNKTVTSLQIGTKDFSDIRQDIDKFMKHREILHSVIGGAPETFSDWFRFAQEEIKTILAHNPDFSIIHNDLNNKNIIIDLDTMKVVSFIDWDHGCISTPLKDIVEPINMFYDFVPRRYNHLRSIYIDAVRSNYTLNISDAELDFLQVYFYAFNKWNYIATFARLISELGNSTNELSIFEKDVCTQLERLASLGKKYSIF